MDCLLSGRSKVAFSHTPGSPAGIAERSGQQNHFPFPVTSESEWPLKQTNFIHKNVETKAEVSTSLKDGTSHKPRNASTGLSRPKERANS